MSELNIPEHWAEVPLSKLVDINMGQSPQGATVSAKKSGVPLIGGAANMKMGKIVVDRFTSAPTKLCESGDIIYCVRATIGKMVIADNTYCLGRGVAGFKPKLNSKFFQYFLQKSEREIQDKATGSTFVQIDKKTIETLSLPLPPKGEQERIVQKIESCFQKIDETGKALKEVEILLMKYQESLLAKAFRGELMPQDPKDEPASNLLERIRVERAKNSKGKKVQDFSPISDDEKVFEVPDSWSWVRLGEICDFQNGNSFKSSDWSKSGLPIIRIQNLNKNGGGDFNYYNKKTMPEWIVEKGDLLFAWSGSKGSSFGANLWQGERGVLNQHIFNVRINKDYIDKIFLYFTLLKFQKRIEDDAHGFKETFVHVRRSDIVNVAVALPPVEEQVRVSKRILHLYTEIDNQLQSLKRKKKILSSLKESVLSKSFEGSLVPRVCAEGTGQELLMKILENEPEIKVSKKITNKKAKK